jgi:hypothetical protein
MLYKPERKSNIALQMQEDVFLGLLACAEAENLTYIWVDLVCIEQESMEDVAEEVKKMKAYYAAFGAVFCDVLGGVNSYELEDQAKRNYTMYLDDDKCIE